MKKLSDLSLADLIALYANYRNDISLLMEHQYYAVKNEIERRLENINFE